jgi:hypothetical protein
MLAGDVHFRERQHGPVTAKLCKMAKSHSFGVTGPSCVGRMWTLQDPGTLDPQAGGSRWSGAYEEQKPFEVGPLAAAAGGANLQRRSSLLHAEFRVVRSSCKVAQEGENQTDGAGRANQPQAHVLGTRDRRAVP